MRFVRRAGSKFRTAGFFVNFIGQPLVFLHTRTAKNHPRTMTISLYVPAIFDVWKKDALFPLLPMMVPLSMPPFAWCSWSQSCAVDMRFSPLGLPPKDIRDIQSSATIRSREDTEAKDVWQTTRLERRDWTLEEKACGRWWDLRNQHG